MRIEKKREALKGANPNQAWIDKIDAMTDKQVTEMYARLKEQDKV